MLTLNNLVKIKFKKPKKVGRGGNRGKNAGRGHKGQVKRAGKTRIGFEGGQKSLLKRTPKLRGLGFKGKIKRNFKELTTSLLSKIITEEKEITINLLRELKLIDDKIKYIKIIRSKGTDYKPKIAKTDIENIKVSKSLLNI